MDKRWCWWLLMAAWIWGSFTPAAWPQAAPFLWPNAPQKPPSRDYVPIPFTGDLEALLRDQLERSGRRELLQELWKKVEEDLKKHHIGSAKFPQLNLQDPKMQKLVEGWLAKPPPALPLPPEQLHKLRQVLKQMENNQAPDAPSSAPAGRQETPPANSALTQNENDLGRWLRDWLNEIEDSKVGDWLRDSPAWRNALEDAQTWMTVPEQPLGWWSPDSWPPDWAIPQGLFGLEKERAWPALGSLNLPKLPAVDLPRLPLPHLSWQPAKGPAALPKFDAGALVQCLGWLAILLAGTWLLWRWGQRLAWSRITGIAAPRTWPVDPSQVTTAAQVILAFEFLALTHLGEQARVWNHRRIAAHWSPDDEHARAAQELAECYETARYAPAGQELTMAQIAAARRHLCLLAEVGRS